MTQDEAIEEATRLIRDGQLWVHEITARGQAPELASIVAVTRTSETVAGITKVYTNPKWRQRGCAERLTRYVCKQYVGLLVFEKREINDLFPRLDFFSRRRAWCFT